MARYLQRGIYKLGEFLLKSSGRDYTSVPFDDDTSTNGAAKEGTGVRRKRTNSPTQSLATVGPNTPPRYKVLILLLAAIIVVLMGLLVLDKTDGRIPWLDQYGRSRYKNTINDGQPPPHKALILASYRAQDVKWLLDIPQDWKVFRYVADNPFARLTTPRNQGREAMVYLTFIIDNYDTLPDYMMFHHGSARGWHQPEPSPMLVNALNLSAVHERGYVNLRCTRDPGCDPPATWMLTSHKPPGTHWASYLMQRFHPYVFRPRDPWFNASYGGGTGMPPLFASPCCAQFAVTRAAVRSKPLEFWLRLREPLLRDLDDFRGWGKDTEMKEWKLGVVYERAWHYFFGRDPVDCPDLDWCRNTMYQGRIHCNGTTSSWKLSQDFETIQCSLDMPKDLANYNAEPLAPPAAAAVDPPADIPPGGAGPPDPPALHAAPAAPAGANPLGQGV